MSTGDKKIYMTLPSAAKVIKDVIEVCHDVFQASNVKVWKDMRYLSGGI